MIIIRDGHDLRYHGDGHRWIRKGESGYTGTWDDLIRTPYTEKQCMNCGQVGAPDDVFVECQEYKK